MERRAWSQAQSILIGWDEALVGVLSRGRSGAVPVHYCVICVKAGRGKEVCRVAQGLSCFLTVKGRLWAEHWEVLGGGTE